jgi:hypothetical protein
MKRYARWASIASIAAVISMTGCGSTDESSGNSPINGVAGTDTGGLGGTTAGAGGTTAGAGGTIAGGVGGMAGAAGAVASGGVGGVGGVGVTGGVGAGATGGSAGVGGAGAMGGAGGDPMGGAGGSMATSMCEPATSVDEDGPFTPTRIENGGATGSSWVFYPEELGKNGMIHPVFNWGPGAGTQPSNYVDHLNRLASHGFVVISQASSGNGGPEIDALDWMLAQNDVDGSPFFQKLDPSKVGAGGHSLGSLTTMAMAGDERLNLYVLVCGGCMSGNGGCGAADIHGPTVILGGDTDIGTPNYEGDYAEITSPVVFVTKADTGHVPCARNNLAPWVAFMRWQWCGEEEWKPKFFDGGEYCANPWECKSKGF